MYNLYQYKSQYIDYNKIDTSRMAAHRYTLPLMKPQRQNIRI